MSTDGSHIYDPSQSDNDLSPTKMRKLDGAASYRTKFNSQWRKELDCIGGVPSDPYR